MHPKAGINKLIVNGKGYHNYKIDWNHDASKPHEEAKIESDSEDEKVSNLFCRGSKM
jgi:hypothetical protein